MICRQSAALLSKFAQPVSIAHRVQTITLRAAQTRTVGLDAAFTVVPLGEDRQNVLNVCISKCHGIKPWLVGEVCSCQILWEHLTTKEEIIEISKLSQRKEKDLETKASNKRKAFEKLWVVGVNLAVEASSPVPNDKTLYYINLNI